VIVDSSAIVAIALREPGYEELVAKLRTAETIGIGTPTLTETGMVLSARLGIEPQALLDRFLRDFRILPVVFGESSIGEKPWRPFAALARDGIRPHSTSATV
jgi:ribonuclease VapC